MIVYFRNNNLQILNGFRKAVHQRCRLVICFRYRRIRMKVACCQKFQTFHHRFNRLNDISAEFNSVSDANQRKCDDKQNRNDQRQKEHSEKFTPDGRNADAPPIHIRERRISDHLCFTAVRISSRPVFSGNHSLTNRTVIFQLRIRIAERNTVFHADER